MNHCSGGMVHLSSIVESVDDAKTSRDTLLESSIAAISTGNGVTSTTDQFGTDKLRHLRYHQQTRSSFAGECTVSEPIATR